MTVTIFVAAALVGYLAGSLSFSRMVGRFVAPGEDLTRTEFPSQIEGEEPFVMTGTGATSLAARAGPRWGCLTGIGDMAKAAIPALVVKLIWPESGAEFVAAATAVVGHNYPIYHGFVGGKGMSPIMGGLFVLDWLTVPAMTAGGMVLGVGLGDGFLAYASGPLLIIPWAIWRGGTAFLLYAVAVNAAYWWAIRPELQEYYRRVSDDGKAMGQRRREFVAQLRQGRGASNWQKQDADEDS